MNNFEDYYKQTLERSNSYSSMKMLAKMYPEKPQQEVPLQISKNDIILGFKNSEFKKENVRLLNLNIFSETETDSIIMACLGQTGTGKTLTAYSLCEDFVFRFEQCLFIYDVKKEAPWHRQPLYSLPNIEEIEKVQDSIGLKLRALDLFIIAPKYMGPQKNVDFYFTLTWPDIMDMAKTDRAEALRILTEILGLGNNDGDSIDIIEDAIDRNNINTFSQLREFVRGVKGKNLKKPGAMLLVRKLKRRFESEIISDNPKYRLQLLKEMKDRQGKGGVVFQGKIKSASDNYIDRQYNALLKWCQTLIMQDGFAWNINRDSNAVLKCDTVVMLEEFDTLCNTEKQNPMTVFERSYGTKSRQAGINLIVVVQEIDMIDEAFVSQIRIFFCSRVSEANALALRKKGVTKENIEWIQDLRLEVETSLGYKAPERCAISKSNEIIVYIPRTPCSQYAFKKT